MKNLIPTLGIVLLLVPPNANAQEPAFASPVHAPGATRTRGFEWTGHAHRLAAAGALVCRAGPEVRLAVWAAEAAHG